MNLVRHAARMGWTLSALLFLAFFSAGAPAALAAFGVSPPFINAEHLVPGATYTQVIYLVQDQPDQDLNIKTDLKLQDPARSWFTTDHGFSFVIPKGVRQFPVTITVDVPKDAGLGAYHGTISFVGAPATAGQVTIALGVQVDINLTVGNDIFHSFSIPYTKVLDIEEGWSPRVLVRLKNDGNVAESLDGATFELFDQYGAVRLAYIQLGQDGNLPQVPAFTTKEFTVEFPIDLHLGLGQYWGTATFYQNQQALASNKGVFDVVPAGSLSSPLSILILNIKKFWVYFAAALIVLLLIGRRLWMIFSRRRRAA